MKFIEDLVRLLAGEIDTVPVAEIPKWIARTIGAETQFAYLSWETVFKQRDHHPELGILDYLSLPTHLREGLVLLESDPRPRLHICYERPDQKRFIATVKATNDGQRMYVVRFHRARSRQTKSLLERSEILRRHKV